MPLHPETSPDAGEELILEPASRSADSWLHCALGDLPALLDDHCQCELKAASNALALIGRNPERESLVQALSSLAQEEMRHYRQVRRLQLGRGGTLSPPLRSPYMQGLQRQRNPQADRLLDELLVAAVIEARSCERFERLSEALGAEIGSKRPGNADLEAVRELYESLIRSERGHAGLFAKLAADCFPAEMVNIELRRRLQLEAELLDGLERSPRMHGGHH
jgi:tRNA-(ms[2]io[6]A)-hydroxylase